MQDLLIILLIVGGGVSLALIAIRLATLGEEIELLKARLDFLGRQQAQPGASQDIDGRRAASRIGDRLFGDPEQAEGREAEAQAAELRAKEAYWVCSGCQRLNAQSARFCIACGQPAGGAGQPETAPGQRELATASIQAESARSAGETLSASSPPEPAAPQPRESLGNLEQLIGQRWMTWVGALFIIVAVGAAVKVMFDMGLFSPAWRLVCECALGLLVLLFGRYLLKQKLQALGQAILGVGLAVFYVSLYAAYSFHALLSAPATLLLVAAVTAGGMLIAIRYEAVAIAIIAILGGLITPGMVSVGDDIQHVLFSYILVLDLGVLAVSLIKRWRMLDIVAFLGTGFLFAHWSIHYYTALAVTPTVAWLCAFFVLFMLVPFAYSMRTGEPLTLERFIAALVNATTMILASWHYLGQAHIEVLGMIALAMSLCYLVLAASFKLRIPADERAHYGLLALSIVFLTLCVPLLLRFNAVIVTWSIEAALLVWLGYRFDNQMVRGAAIPVLGVALIRLSMLNWGGLPHLDAIFFNPHFGTALSIAIGAGVAALIHQLFDTQGQPFDRTCKTMLAIGAGLLALILTNLEVSAWFSQQVSNNPDYLSYYSQVVQLVVWVVGATLFLAAGLSWRAGTARTTGKLLIGVAVIAAFWIYLGLSGSGHGLPGAQGLFWNARFAAVLSLVAAVFTLAWLHALHTEHLPAAEQRAPTHFSVAGGLMLLIVVAGEISCWFASLPGGHRDQLHVTALSWQTLVWALGALAFLAAGLRWRSYDARVAGVVPLVLGSLTGFAAYGLAHAYSDPLSHGGIPVFNLRFAVCLVLVLVLFAYGLLIRRSRAVCIAQEQGLATATYVAADFLLLILLSTEVYRYFHALALPGTQAADQANVALSIVWGVYALAFILAGFWLRKAAMRLWAMALFGVTAAKLVLFDLSHMPPVSRLISLVVVGILMLVTAYLYHGAESRLAGSPSQ